MTAVRRREGIPGTGEDYFCAPPDMDARHRCVLKNISATGACVASKRALKKDDMIYLHVRGREGGLLKSRVVWKTRNTYGLLFSLESSEDFDSISRIMNAIHTGAATTS
ncbi:MAG: PilZ domain-containing protein [Spirochaetes bacterium]|nr:MAG: PilZ domain-containing protein [Spirochaetota bacterium]